MKAGTNKVLRRVFWLLFAVLALLALRAGLAAGPSAGKLAPGRVVVLDDQWTVSVRTKTGTVEYGYLIPEDAGTPLRLCVKSYLAEFEVLLDGEPIYSFEDAYATEGRSQHMVTLPRDAEGKELTVRTGSVRPETATGKQLGSVYLGQENEALIKLLRDNLYALVFLIFSILLGAAMLTAAFRMRGNSSRDI